MILYYPVEKPEHPKTGIILRIKKSGSHLTRSTQNRKVCAYWKMEQCRHGSSLPTRLWLTSIPRSLGFYSAFALPRSLDGEGNFNWRFVFPFMFLAAEKVLVVRKKVIRESSFHLNFING